MIKKKRRDVWTDRHSLKYEQRRFRVLNFWCGFIDGVRGKSEEGAMQTNEEWRESGWEETPTVTQRDEKPAERDI